MPLVPGTACDDVDMHGTRVHTGIRVGSRAKNVPSKVLRLYHDQQVGTVWSERAGQKNVNTSTSDTTPSLQHPEGGSA